MYIFHQEGYPRLVCSKLDLVNDIYHGCLKDNLHNCWLITSKGSWTYIYSIDATLFTPRTIYIAYKNIMSFTNNLFMWTKLEGSKWWQRILFVKKVLHLQKKNSYQHITAYLHIQHHIWHLCWLFCYWHTHTVPFNIHLRGQRPISVRTYFRHICSLGVNFMQLWFFVSNWFLI